MKHIKNACRHCVTIRFFGPLVSTNTNCIVTSLHYKIRSCFREKFGVINSYRCFTYLEVKISTVFSEGCLVFQVIINDPPYFIRCVSQ